MDCAAHFLSLSLMEKVTRPFYLIRTDKIRLFSCPFGQGKSRQLSLPASPPMPSEPGYNLHKKAGGSPLCCFFASNVQPASFSRPGGLQSAAEVLASLMRDVGLNGL